VQRAPVRTLVGVQCVRVLIGPPRPKGLEAWFLGSGSGRVEPVVPLTLIEGTDGVTEIEGALIFGPRTGVGASLMAMIGISGVTEMEGTFALRPLLTAGDSLMDMLGMGGVTPIEGAFTLEPRLLLLGALTDIDGVSDTEMVGIEDGSAD
jgi:hypothetical protein